MTRPQVSWIAAEDSESLDALRRFALERLYDRALLYAAVSCPPFREGSRLARVALDGRLAGAAALIEGVFPFRAVSFWASLPGSGAPLLCEIEPPFVVLAPEPVWHVLTRCGGRRKLDEVQMARLRCGPVPDPVRRVEPVERPEEIGELVGQTPPDAHFRAGPFLGIRRGRELVACGGVHFVTDRIAQIGYVCSRDDGEGGALAADVLYGLVRALESGGRRLVAEVDPRDLPRVELFARAGFRGRVRTARFTFDERPR